MKTKLLKKVLFFLLLFSVNMAAFAQRVQKPVELVQEALRKSTAFTPLRIQSLTGDIYRSRLSQQVNNYSLFSFKRSADLNSGTPVELTLPSPEGLITLQLIPVNIYAEGFSIKTSSGEKLASTGWFYQGIVKGDNGSIAAISIFDDEIAGFISTGKGNMVIGKLRNTGAKDGMNIVYPESALRGKPSFNCSTPEISLPVPAINPTALTNRCVRIYYETEVDFYTAFSNNATSVTNYVTNLFNQNKTLYNNDGVSVTLSGMLVWTTTDPYTGTSSASLLSQFQSTRTSFNGDLGQLITTRSIGGGQAAVIYGLCNASVANRLCVSGNLTTSFSNVPTYSWEVYVTTHELGHLMGSRHTHACVWNGNNTAIDGCAGSTEGGCSTPGSPSGGGTIMSYCHLTTGIDFSLGFGPQPAAQIRFSVEASACLLTCAEPAAACSDPVTGLMAYNVTDTSATFIWTSMGSNATGYTLEYRAVGAGSWTSVGPFVFNTMGITGLSPNTAYEYRVKAHCRKGGTSPYATGTFSTLETGVPCGTVTNITGSPDCGQCDISWTPVPDASIYIVEYKKTTSSTWLTADSTPYTGTTIYGTGGFYNVRIKVNCAGGTGNYGTGTVSILSSHAPQCQAKMAGIKNPKEEPAVGLKLQPQPARSQVTVTYNSVVQSKGVVTVHSQFGAVLLSKSVRITEGDNRIELNISSLKQGIYIVQLQTGEKVISERLVVN